ncbi:MAG TPA: radical SAM protein [bacterium]|nr:radical SAM protein [bacterium]
MKVLFTYIPQPFSKKGYLLVSQNRFTKWRGTKELIYPLIPASGLTLLDLKGYEVYYLDCIFEEIDEKNFFEYIENLKPDIIFTETKTPIIKYHWIISEKIKRKFPQIITCIIGDHITVLPEETMKNSKFDFVLTGGDFDFYMLQLVQFLSGKEKIPSGLWYREKNGKIKNTGKFILIDNLDSLPFINREIVPWKNYHEAWRISENFMYLSGSRGCPYRCTFCSWPQMLFDNKIRYRSPENIVNEIEFLVKKYKTEEFFFDDDTFTFNKKWCIEICEEIIKRNLKIMWSCNGRVDNVDEFLLKKMKDAGCRLIKYGVESYSQYTLNKIKKGYTIQQVKKAFSLTKKRKILIHATAMIGFPWETRKDILNTIGFIKSLKPDTCQFSIPITYPGTELFKEAEEKNWLKFNYNWEKYDMSLPTLKNLYLSDDKLVKLCKLAWGKIYLDPLFILRKVLRIRTISEVKWLIRGFISFLFGHVKPIQK